MDNGGRSGHFMDITVGQFRNPNQFPAKLEIPTETKSELLKRAGIISKYLFNFF